VILGSVADRFPRVPLVLSTASGSVRVEFIVDTGFDGELALPPSLAANIGIRIAPGNVRSIVLANGRTHYCGACETSLIWQDDGERLTEVLLLDGEPLLGVQLLAGQHLSCEFEEDGEVTIDSLE